MLESLHISNYALIDTVDITFYSGLNIITGETGAGKSIMLGALSLILGGRADIKAIRDSNRKSIIEAIFTVEGYSGLKKYCQENDIEWNDSQCILRREIAPAGRSRAFINDSPVTLDHLSYVAMQLIDIHSQHQNLLLASAEYQLSIIDNLADNGLLLKEFGEKYNNYRIALKQLRETRNQIERNRADEDFIRFQLEQLENMHLVKGEQEDLERERELQANMTQIKSILTGALENLIDGDNNALSLLSSASSHCDSLSKVLDDTENKLCERLESAKIEIQDIAETLAQYDRALNADPQELERIEDRLNSLYSLEQKHKVENSDQLIAVRDALRSRLAELENSELTIVGLEDSVRHTRSEVKELAIKLSNRRKEEAKRFASMLKERAIPLGMKNLQVDVAVNHADLSPTGIDRVEFLFAFNKNQPLMPVGVTASGGEISRLMLSIKAIIAEKMQLPSIIFDEVDTGVSGDVANRMGEMMQAIGRHIQVIAITHLPQVASKGAYHYKVYKQDNEESTLTHIDKLTPEQRIDELSIMLSGSHVDEAARANARALLNI